MTDHHGRDPWMPKRPLRRPLGTSALVAAFVVSFAGSMRALAQPAPAHDTTDRFWRAPDGVRIHYTVAGPSTEPAVVNAANRHAITSEKTTPTRISLSISPP